MPGKLSTHVLDTMHGRPAANLQIELFSAGKLLKTVRTNADGRTDQPLLTGADLNPGEYELVFHIGDYFGEKKFLDKVPVRFRVSDASQNYHVPLLCTPWAYSAYRGFMNAREILRRADILGKITDVPGTITRTYRSPAMQRANAQVTRWMRKSGLTVREDPAGNLIGQLASKNPQAKTLILGSHLDTVRDAGKYDGILGVLTAIAVAGELRDLPFHLEVYAFADEEGCRYATGYLGSGAVTGLLTQRDLQRKDADGVPLGKLIRNLAACRRNPRDLLGYAEVHIEQGPVLDRRKLAVGVVKAIAGQTRALVTFTGCAGHAGTTPMKMRRDALCAAAGFIFVTETIARKEPGLVATVGTVSVTPGAANVIPGKVVCSLDVRHEDDRIRRRTAAEIMKVARIFGKQRQVTVSWETTADVPAVACADGWMRALTKAARKYQPVVSAFVSGAGHDAAAMAAITPVVMLFVRCKDGISHNPAESVRERDVAVAATVLRDFVRLLAK